jgi:hypothetical protein
MLFYILQINCQIEISFFFVKELIIFFLHIQFLAWFIIERVIETAPDRHEIITTIDKPDRPRAGLATFFEAPFVFSSPHCIYCKKILNFYTDEKNLLREKYQVRSRRWAYSFTSWETDRDFDDDAVLRWFSPEQSAKINKVYMIFLIN